MEEGKMKESLAIAAIVGIVFTAIVLCIPSNEDSPLSGTTPDNQVKVTETHIENIPYYHIKVEREGKVYHFIRFFRSERLEPVGVTAK
jgi:hypothetical protein